jgi:hypothetical protein
MFVVLEKTLSGVAWVDGSVGCDERILQS